MADAHDRTAIGTPSERQSMSPLSFIWIALLAVGLVRRCIKTNPGEVEVAATAVWLAGKHPD